MARMSCVPARRGRRTPSAADCRFPDRRGRAIGRRGPAIVLFVGILLASVVVSAETIDRVLAVVSGDVILLSDVTAARALRLVSVDETGDPVRAVLSKLVDRELVLAEVDRYAPPEPDAATIDREMDSVRHRFPDDTTFEEALSRSGLDERHLRETLRQELRLRSYLQQRFTVSSASEDEIQQYYRSHQSDFERAGQPVPLADVRAAVVQAVTADIRQAMIADWIAGLRRRADINDLYLAGP
jgi:hypothetical protein